MAEINNKRQLDVEPDTGVGSKKPRADVDSLQDIRVLIDNPEASIVIGKGGTNVKMVRTESTAFVSILKSDIPTCKERVLTLKGTPEANAKAVELISRLLISANNERKQAGGEGEQKASDDYSFRLLVHKFLAGCIIGKGGTIIKEIQQQTGVRMSISNEPMPGSTEKLVTITGSAEAIHSAVHRIFGQLNENPLREGSSNIVYVPGGAPPAAAYSPYGVPPMYGRPPVQHPHHPAHAHPHHPPAGYGHPVAAAAPTAQPGYPPAGYAQQMPYAPDPTGNKTEKIVIPAVCAGTVIGKSGTIIAEIKAQSGCQISIAAAEPTAPQDRIVSITGTAQGIGAAINLIRQRVESYQPHPGAYGAY